jgi:hypothetical protein
MMNHDQLEILEGELEKDIGRVVRRLARAKQIGPVPPGRIYQFMAKAAAAVFEAATDEEKE